jgi:hypothetical protein
MCSGLTAAGGSVQGAGADVARPGWPRRRVVEQMEHQTGPDRVAEADAPVPDAMGESRVAASAGAGADSEYQVAAGERTGEASGPGRPEPVSATGELRVDAALRLLDRLPGLPVSEHPELFEQVHAQLSEVLGELDSGPAGPAGG